MRNKKTRIALIVCDILLKMTTRKIGKDPSQYLPILCTRDPLMLNLFVQVATMKVSCSNENIVREHSL